MSRNLGWIAVSILLGNSLLSVPYASYAQSSKCSKCITKSGLRVTTASQDAVTNTFKLSTQQFIAAPTTQLFPGEAGKTIMTMDFPGILWDKPAQVIYPANEEIESVRLGQFQCDPPIFRVSITTSNPLLLNKIAVDAHTGNLILKFPPPSPKPPSKSVIPLSAKKEEYIKPVTQRQGGAGNLSAGGLLLNLQKQSIATGGAMAIASSWPNHYPGGGGQKPFIGQGNPPPTQPPFNQTPPGSGGYPPQGPAESAPLPGSSTSQTSGGTITGSQLMPQQPDPTYPVAQNGPPYQQGGPSRWSRTSQIALPVAAGGAAGAATAALWPRHSSRSQTIIAGGGGGYGPPLTVPVSNPVPGAQTFPANAPSISTTTTTTINRTTINRTTTINSAPAITSPGQLAPTYQIVNNYPQAAPISGAPTIITNSSSSSGNPTGAILAGAGAGIAAGALTGVFMHRNSPAYPPAAPPSGLANQPVGYPPSAPSLYGPAVSSSPSTGLPGSSFGPSGPSNSPVPLSAGPAQKISPLAQGTGTKTPAAIQAPGQLMGGDKNRMGLFGAGGSDKRTDPFVSISGSDSQKVIIRFNPNYSTYKTFRLEDPPRYVVDIDNGPLYWDISEAENTVNSWLSGVRIGHPDDAGTVTRVVLDLTQQKVALFENLDRTKGWLNITMQAPASETYLVTGKMVVLDAGHGGSDPGAQRGDVQEKELTLAITKKLDKYLQAHGLKTVMTRSDDTFVSLEDRVRITNSVAPNAFVSIHINSLETNSSIHGIETYYQTEQSRPLADRIHQSLVSGLIAPDRSVRKARFYVVNHTPIPAILAEVGFISNKEERDKLISSEYQSMIAESVGQGVMLYLSSLSTDGTQSAAAPLPGTEALSAGQAQAIQASRPIKMSVPPVIIVPNIHTRTFAQKALPPEKLTRKTASKTVSKTVRTSKTTVRTITVSKVTPKKHTVAQKNKKLASNPKTKSSRRSHVRQIAAIGS